ncbi:hypothetical protein ACGFN1_37600 [Streptomyces sp. NPDC048685]|nr:hypothetical protein [Streptomyces sp. NBC_01768]WSC34039.1 hypothetical protein OG902_46745 [Streptomyces sp. NBC_01768]
MNDFHYAAGLLLSLSSIAAALASPFVIIAARRTAARIHAQSDQKEQ